MKIEGNLYNGKADDVEDRFRNAVLDALDIAAKDSGWGVCGWTDQDLPEIFKVIDAQRLRAQKRYERKNLKRMEYGAA